MGLERFGVSKRRLAVCLSVWAGSIALVWALPTVPSVALVVYLIQPVEVLLLSCSVGSGSASLAALALTPLLAGASYVLTILVTCDLLTIMGRWNIAASRPGFFLLGFAVSLAGLFAGRFWKRVKRAP